MNSSHDGKISVETKINLETADTFGVSIFGSLFITAIGIGMLVTKSNKDAAQGMTVFGTIVLLMSIINTILAFKGERYDTKINTNIKLLFVLLVLLTLLAVFVEDINTVNFIAASFSGGLFAMMVFYYSTTVKCRMQRSVLSPK